MRVGERAEKLKADAAEAAKVVSLAPRRRVPRITTAWLVAAALSTLVVGTGAVTVAWRDDAGDNHPVASVACLVVEPKMKLEGTVTRTGDAFTLVLATPLCGPESGFVQEVALASSQGGEDLAQLAGRGVRIEGLVSARDASTPFVVLVQRASRP